MLACCVGVVGVGVCDVPVVGLGECGTGSDVFFKGEMGGSEGVGGPEGEDAIEVLLY